ncbi:MAG: hypothetical protein JW908_06255 [Anaerolineales bacterium]|nr:hypothetical protein [Anaerolineales bacterium]
MTSAPSTRWQNRIIYLAGIWSAVYGFLGIYWLQGGASFPFGKNDPGAELSPLKNLTVAIGAPIIIILGFLGVIIAFFMLRQSTNRLFQIASAIYGISMAVVLFLVVPDYRLLAGVAYAPLVILGAPFDWPAGIDLSDIFPWPAINQGICVLGGFIWIAATLLYYRQNRNACVYCGRSSNINKWTSPEAASQWGKWATYIAAVVPLIYAITRYAWALGIPLGLSQESFQQGYDNGVWLGGAGLATVALCGSMLTLGLIQCWGEVFPRWMLGLAGKNVPPLLAIIPAAIISILVTSTGINIFSLVVSGTSLDMLQDENWGANTPILFWPLWGIALGIATLAYYYRRRGRCKYCGMI